MAYEKQTWHTGDVITEGKLNHMEDGIAGALSGENVMIVHVTYDHGAVLADKTLAEIGEAVESGISLVALYYSQIYVWEGEDFDEDSGQLIRETFSNGARPYYFIDGGGSHARWLLRTDYLYFTEDGVEEKNVFYEVPGMEVSDID